MGIIGLYSAGVGSHSPPVVTGATFLDDDLGRFGVKVMALGVVFVFVFLCLSVFRCFFWFLVSFLRFSREFWGLFPGICKVFRGLSGFSFVLGGFLGFSQGLFEGLKFSMFMVVIEHVLFASYCW